MKFRFCFCVILIVLLVGYGMVVADSFIENEAGISCSTKLDSADISVAASAYKNIEAQTEEYIIGSIALKDYGETEDVHVYLASTGEMIAYYLKHEPVGKIIDWRHDQTGALAGSKLEDAMQKVCDALSVSLPEVKYYHFRYPEATDIKIIVDERHYGTDTYVFQIPEDHLIDYSGWSFCLWGGGYCGGTNSIAIDDTTLFSGGGSGGWYYRYGEISSDLISPDGNHTFTTISTDKDCHGSYGAMILLYHLAQ